MRRPFPVLVLVLSSLVGVAAAGAPGPDDAQSKADTQAIQSHALVLKKVEQVLRANEALVAAAAQNPAFAKTLHAQMEGSGSLKDAEAKLDRAPQAAAAIKKAGLTTREYLLTVSALQLAVMQHQLGSTAQPQDVGPATKANVAFVEHHPKEVEAFKKGLQKLEGDEDG